MKKRISDGQIVEVQPFDNAPEEFVFYVRDRWLAQLEENLPGPSPLDDRLISYLEYEAVSALTEKFPELPPQPVIDRDRPLQGAAAEPRAKFSPRPPPKVRDSYEAAFDRWRSVWVVEARHHEQFSHTYPKKIEAAINILLTASRLRSALEDGDSQRAAALGMLLAFEAIGGGYGLELESKIESSQALEKARKTAYANGVGLAATDYKRAEDACIRRAADIWAKDRTRRMKAVEDDCRQMLLDQFEQLPKLDKVPAASTIRAWIKQAGKDGRLSIPPEAQRPGADRKE